MPLSSNSLSARVFVLSFLACCLGVAAAQEQPVIQVKNPIRGHCELDLLAHKGVQTDLGLSANQVAKIQDLVGELVEKQHDLKQEQFSLLTQRNQAVALAALKPEQVLRLKQISYQWKATASLRAAEVSTPLGITEEQFKKMNAIPYANEIGDDKAETVESIRKDFGNYPKRQEEAWQMREWRTLAVLTPMQRTKYKEMLGKPYDGPIGGPVSIPAISSTQKSQSLVSDLNKEITELRERVANLEKRLAEVEKRK